MPFPVPHILHQLRLAAALMLWTGAMQGMGGLAQAQSIGDWNGAYHAPPPSASPPPRTRPSPKATHTPASRPRHHSRRVPHPPQASAPPPDRNPPPASAGARAPVPRIEAPPPTTTPPPIPARAQAAPSPATPAPVPAPRIGVAPPAKPAGEGQDLPQWPLGLAAILGGAAGWALWRRKSRPDLDLTQPPPEQTPPEQTPPPPLAARPGPAPHATPPPELCLDFLPTRFATTLTEAILRYELTVTNHTGQALGPLVLAGAMEASVESREDHASAHPPAVQARAFPPASGFNPHPLFTPEPEAPTEQAPEPSSPMPELYRLAQLQSGESTTLQGQLRLPLAAIVPIRLGGAALFVPLVRVQADAIGLHDDMLIAAQLCVMVGEAAPPSTQGGKAGLGPFQLDAGPTIARHLAMRPISGRKTPGTPLGIAV